MQVGYPRTAAEIAASVTPTDYSYDPLDIRRYGALPGLSNDCHTAIQNAINVAAASGSTGGIVSIPQGTWRTTMTLTIAAGQLVNIQGAGKLNSILYGGGLGSNVPILAFNGTTGSRIDSILVRGFSLQSDNVLACGITSTWVINSDFSDLYFYQLLNGWVGTNSFGIGFRNCNAFGVTGDCYQLNVNSNNIFFEKTRFVGTNGVNVKSTSDTLTFVGCDFEGIVSNGAAILLAPVTGTICHNVTLIGNHFENINGTALLCNGADANSVRGLLVANNYIYGGFVDNGNTNAVNAVQLYNVNGFTFENNDINDWSTNAFLTNSTESNGRVANNVGGRVTNLTSAAGFRVSVWYYNNFVGPGASFGVNNELALTYGTTIATNASLVGPQTEGIFDITATNGVAFTISNPTSSTKAQVITYKIRNTSGGALGAITWGVSFKMAAWTSPATGFSRSITFAYDGSNWIEKSRTTVDIPN